MKREWKKEGERRMECER